MSDIISLCSWVVRLAADKLELSAHSAAIDLSVAAKREYDSLRARLRELEAELAAETRSRQLAHAAAERAVLDAMAQADLNSDERSPYLRKAESRAVATAENVRRELARREAKP